MATVKLAGRFPKGTRVTLYEARHHSNDAAQLRPDAGSKEKDAKRVKDDGTVSFSGLQDGKRYFAYGIVDGFPVSVRLTARDSEDDTAFAQAPVEPTRVRLSDGTWADEVPEYEKVDKAQLEAAPHLSQTQVPPNTPQRSDTPRGTAHPVDTDETPPYGRQEDVKKGVQQRSDTPTGMATPIDVAYQRQDEVPNGVWQRSATPVGEATVIPGGGPVEVQRMKESVEAKEKRGEPVKAAAAPLTGVQKVHSDPKSAGVATGPRSGGKEVSNAPVSESQPEFADQDPQFKGLDAEGQPIAEDVAAAQGEEPADAPAEPVRRSSKSSKK